MPLFPDNTPYLLPPEFVNSPPKLLEMGRMLQDQGAVSLRGVSMPRLQHLVEQYGLYPAQQAAANQMQDPTALGYTLRMPDGSYVIYYYRRLPETMQQAVINHELAHVGGWNSAHDGKGNTE